MLNGLNDFPNQGYKFIDTTSLQLKQKQVLKSKMKNRSYKKWGNNGIESLSTSTLNLYLPNDSKMLILLNQ